MFIYALMTLFLLFILSNAYYTCHKSYVFCYYLKDFEQFCKEDLHIPESSNTISNLETNNINDRFSKIMELNGLYRPRSALARALYEKQRNDGHLRDFDKNEWYKVEESRLSPELQQKFVQLGPDEETKQFLAQCIDKSSWIWTQIWYLLAKAVLRHFWTITDINGWLGRGSMFVLSSRQTSTLLSASRPGGASLSSVVDIGAGDGEVVRRFADLFTEIYATEISASMRSTLASKGYKVLDADHWWEEGKKFSCVCMLNLLDRCSRPRTMLREARTALAVNGTLIVALVLPYKPYVEVTPDHKPEERLPIGGEAFEDQVAAFIAFMKEEGWDLGAWSRTPYLCEGDFKQSYYWLDDSIYLFTPTVDLSVA